MTDSKERCPPKRVRMHRRKGGWRHEHPDAIVVARPTRWGNPFIAGPHRRGSREARAWAAGRHRDWLNGCPTCATLLGPPPTQEEIRAALQGADLACWCPLDAPCHADTLLEIANRPSEGDT